MRNHLLLILLLCCAQIALAIQGNIRGKATDKSSGENLVGAEIVLLKGKKSIGKTVTDGDGNFVINVTEPGTYDLLCLSPMHIPQKIVGLQLKQSGTRLAYFKLNPDGRMLSDQGRKGKKNQYRDSIDVIYTYASLQAKQQAEAKTATSFSQSLFDVPVTGYIISAEDIEQRGYMHLIDILREIPELELNENVNSTTQNMMSSRGIVGSGAWVILQDGVRLSTFTAADITISNNVMIRHAAQVDIIIGASSVIYGADAVAGVINIISKQGDKLNGAELLGSYGMFDNTNNSLVIGLSKNDFSLVGGLAYFQSQSPYYPKYYPEHYQIYTNHYLTQNRVLSGFDDTSFIQLDGNPAKFSMPSRALSSNLKIKYKNLEIGWFGNSEMHSSVLANRYEYAPPSAARQYGSRKNNLYIQHVLKRKKWDLNSILQANSWKTDKNSNYSNFYSNYQTVHKYAFENSLLLRLLLNYKLSDQQNLTLGGCMQFSNILASTSDLPKAWENGKTFDEQNFYYIGTDTTDYLGNHLGIRQIGFRELRTRIGSFAQYQLQLKNKFSLLAGLRFDYNTGHHLYENDFHIYPIINLRLGLVYKPNNNLRLKLFYGEADLVPSTQLVFEHYGSFSTVKDSLGRITGVQAGYWKLPSNVGTLEDGTADDERMRPARSRGLEFNTTYSKNDFFVSGNAFYNLYSNMLVSQAVTNMPFVDTSSQQVVAYGQILASSGSAYCYGGTLRVEYKFRPSEHFDIRLNTAYSYACGEQTNPTNNTTYALPYTARHSLKAGLNIRYKAWNTYISSLARSISTSDVVDGAWLENKAFVVFNLHSRYTVAKLDKERTQIHLFANIQNLTDARYYHIGIFDPTGLPAVPQMPLTITGGVSVNFNR